MKHIAIALASFSLLWSLGTKAMNVTGPEAEGIKGTFLTLLKNYHDALVSAMKQSAMPTSSSTVHALTLLMLKH